MSEYATSRERLKNGLRNREHDPVDLGKYTVRPDKVDCVPDRVVTGIFRLTHPDGGPTVPTANILVQDFTPCPECGETDLSPSSGQGVREDRDVLYVDRDEIGSSVSWRSEPVECGNCGSEVSVFVEEKCTPSVWSERLGAGSALYGWLWVPLEDSEGWMMVPRTPRSWLREDETEADR